MNKEVDIEKTLARLSTQEACLVNTQVMKADAAASNFGIQRRGSRQAGDVSVLGTTRYGNTPRPDGYNQAQWGPFGYLNEVRGFQPSNGFQGGALQGSQAGYSRDTQVAKNKMYVCVSAYKGFGVAKNVIDLMANFASEGLTIKHPNKTNERFYQKWAKMVDLQGRVKDAFRYYYKFGNVFIYRNDAVIREETYNSLRRSRAKVTKESVKDFHHAIAMDNNNSYDTDRREEDRGDRELRRRRIPWRYTFLNPFQMDVKGDKYFGRSRWVFLMDPAAKGASDVEARRSSPVDHFDESDVRLPPEFKAALDSNDADMHEGRVVVELDQSKLTTLHYMKDDHEDWADPMLWPVMPDIFYKNKLREMDISACDSIINAVVVYKLGSIKDGIVVSQEQLRNFAQMLRQPTQAMSIVWNDALSIEDSFPPVEKILGPQKYEAVDKDILRGVGISDVLLGGAGSSSFSNSFLGVRTLLERLEEGRRVIQNWVERELESIATVLGHKRLPRVRFGKMSLRDEQKEKQLIVGLLDRNIISVEAVLEAFGEDFEIEHERLKSEDKIRDKDGVFKKHGPFADPMNQMTDEERQAEMSEADPTEMQDKKFVRRVNGRPPGRNTPHSVRRETKPQGMASLHRAKAQIIGLHIRLLAQSQGVSFDEKAAGFLANSVASLITDRLEDIDGDSVITAIKKIGEQENA